MKTGKVYLTGAGPGKADLITVRGLNILKEADFIIHDYLVDERILEYAGEDVEIICAGELAGKGKHARGSHVNQKKINDLLVKKAQQGKKTIRLKNGDPSIFGRFTEELDALVKADIEFEIVPGVTAASAAACWSGIPLTDRELTSSCVFVTGHENLTKEKSFINWDKLAKNETIVLYMAVGNLEKVVKHLLKSGKDKHTPVVVIQEATLPAQRVLTGVLNDITVRVKKKKIKPPAIVIVGDVAARESRFNWLRKNKRVLFTGLSEERFFITGTYFHLPLIKIQPLDDYTEFDRHLKNIQGFDWIVFASRYGVEHFFKRLKIIGYDSRTLAGINIAVVGNSTGNWLLDFGLKADLIPQEESSRGLIEAFKQVQVKGEKIFLPRSDIADKGLKKELEKLGAKVTESLAYRNVEVKNLPDLDLNLFDEIVLTSPSTVRSFKKRYGEIPEDVEVRCIGKVTLKEAKRCQLSGWEG